MLSAEHVLNLPNAFEVAWVYFSFNKINGFVIKFLHSPCLMVTLTSANVWQASELEMKHAVFESASNFAAGQSNPSCQRNIFINLHCKYTPAYSTGHVRTLFSSRSVHPPAFTFLEEEHERAGAYTHTHLTCTHTLTHSDLEVSRCLKPFVVSGSSACGNSLVFHLKRRSCLSPLKQLAASVLQSLAGRQQQCCP